MYTLEGVSSVANFITAYVFLTYKAMRTMNYYFLPRLIIIIVTVFHDKFITFRYIKKSIFI